MCQLIQYRLIIQTKRSFKQIMSSQQQSPPAHVLSRLKLIIFQLLYVIDSHKFTNIHLLAIVQLLQPIVSIYYYLNPIFIYLDNMAYIQQFHDNIWPQIAIFIPSQSPIVSIILLLVFPCFLLVLIMMKYFIGYQYLIILTMELFILAYPLLFVMFVVDGVELIVTNGYIGVGVILAIMHGVGALAALHMYGKKYKMLVDMPLIILIQVNITQYAILSFLILRLAYLYVFTPPTILKPFKLNLQLSLLLILIFCYFTTDTLTNYISFLLLLGPFTLSPLISITQHYLQHVHLLPSHYNNIFYQIEHLQEQQPTIFKLKFYQFLEQHIGQCVDVHCQCRSLVTIKQGQELKQKALKVMDRLYAFRQDYESLIEYAMICYTHFGHRLSGLIPIYTNPPQSLYQQYTSYSIITSYQQQYRQGDRNYHFGLSYNTFYQDLRLFQQKIQSISITLKQFWLTILQFDGSRKFLSMILQISEKINQITKLFDENVDKYDQHRGYFLYLYKTFQLVILNSQHNDDLGVSMQGQQLRTVSGVDVKQHLTSLTRQQKVTVPQRMPFFVSDQASAIINCNREFCNLVEIDRQDLLGNSYAMFVPKYCHQQHKEWVRGWFNDCHKDKQFTESIKTIQLDQLGFVKSTRILTKIFPRFDHSLQTITFVKIITQLACLSHVGLYQQHSSATTNTKVATYQSPQQRDNNNIIDQNFFSILIESQSMRIVAIDESFFACVNIEQSQQSLKRVLSLRLSQIFPKLLNSWVDGDKGHHKQHHVKDMESTLQKQMLQSHMDSMTKLQGSQKQKNHRIKQNKHQNKHDRKPSIQSIQSQSHFMISVITQSSMFPKQVILNHSILQQFIIPPPKLTKHHPNPSQRSINSPLQNTVSNSNIPPQPISSYNKLKPYIITQSKQLIFNCQVIPQQNISMQTKYCIVHFKKKQRDSQKSHRNPLQNLSAIQSLNYHNPHITMRRNRMSEDRISVNEDAGVVMKSVDYSGVGSKRSLGKVSINSKLSENISNINSKKSSIIHNSEHSSSALASNTGFRESFIRSSKSQSPNTVSIKAQSSTESQSEQSPASLSSQKNYCLPWPILFPLIIIHILYLSATQHHSATLQYLNHTFTFYDMYEVTILKQLAAFFNLGIYQNIDYLSSMKQLWMQGYGFYQNSFLVFENYVANDSHMMRQLFMTIVAQNQYSIYLQIGDAFSGQQQVIYTLYLAIMLTLAAFIIYILIDFTLNLHYCFSVSSQVTDIILIFLNVSEKDINKLILSIEHYQASVLEINDFAEMRKIMKKELENYNLQEKQEGDMSGLGLLKRGDNNSNVLNDNIFKQMGVYIDSVMSSPLQSIHPNFNLIKAPNNAFIQAEPLYRPSTINYNARRFINSEQQAFRLGTMKRRKTTRTEKMNIDVLRATLGFLNQESENEGEDLMIQKAIGSQVLDNNVSKQHQQQFISNSGVSSRMQSINQLTQLHSQHQQHLPTYPKRSPHRKTYLTQHQPQLTQQQLSKLQKISKFKSRFRGKLNDIKQHPYLYTILFVSLGIAMIVMIVTMVIVPQYIITLETFQQRYFDLRAMKMIVYKQLVQKIVEGNITMVLQPNITSSVYGQGFYNNVRSTLNALPVFQAFWVTVYTKDNCPLLVSNSQQYARCVSIGANITGYGQKIMLQYIEDLLGRLTMQQLFTNTSSSSNPTSKQFFDVVTLQIDIISEGQSLMRQQITQYTQSVQNYQTIIVIVGTLMLGVCILLSRRALKGILAKIQDGENLLLVMPESIKNKYIGSVKKTKSIKQIKQLQAKQRLIRQRRQKRLATLMKISNKSNISSISNNNNSKPPLPPPSQAQHSAVNLINHRHPSSLPNPSQQQVLHNALKNRPQLKLNSDSNSSHITNKGLKYKAKVQQR